MKCISFLCRFPGSLIVTLVGVAASFLKNSAHLDGRWWIGIVVAVVATIAINLMLFIIQGEKNGQFNAHAKWVPIIIVGIMSILFLGAIVGLETDKDVRFPSDHAIQLVLVESIGVVLFWAFFTLAWNMNVFRFMQNRKLLHQ